MAGLSFLNPVKGAELRASEVVLLNVVEASQLPAVPPRDFRVFRRAYAARPTVEGLRAALATGCYPHAAPGRPTLTDLLKPVPISMKEYNGAALAEAPPNAVVVITAASGAVMDEPSEQSIHVPLWVRGPGFTPGYEQRLASLTDIVPTLLGTAKVGVPAHVQGRDLNGPAREIVFSYGRLSERDEWRALIRGFDKIVVDRQLTIVGLYNLALDPEESNNLAESIAHGRLRDELRAYLRATMQQLGDQMDPSGLKRR